MFTKYFNKVNIFIFLITALLNLTACSSELFKRNQTGANSKVYKSTQEQLQNLLKNPSLGKETQYAIINGISNNMLSVKDYNSLILFLTEWVEEHPADTYNAYWLLKTACAYLETDAEPIAEYYFERIINNYSDLMVQGKSIHFLCLQHLIQISTVPSNRISYFNQLINYFPNEVSITELYYRLALEYEKEGEWTLAIKSFTQFLDQKDSSTIQIAGIPNAYLTAKQLIDFNNSSKDWTFETLDELVAAVKKAITSYTPKTLDKYRSKVNFFAMSWRQDEYDANAQESFSMSDFMKGNRIKFSSELDDSSSPTEAYLRTWGWSTYINIWYLYFRKVNFPADPDIHGRWEWAGIYYGEKL